LLPSNREIWHSLDRPLPNRRNLWHYDEDIRSRPLYANYVDADVLINLHTNASTNAAASGTRAYVARDRPYDLELANSILCGMKELIHAQEPYRNFNVASQAEESARYGENNKAHMPAVVLEVGFHTNLDDAAALKDPVFREAAMKGVEKGLRLKAEGKVCEPFKIDNIPDVAGPHNTDIPAEINYAGYPQFSVEQKTESVSCPSNWNCSPYSKVHADSESPLTFNFRCSATSSTPTATFRWRTILMDADGVITNVIQHSSTCTREGLNKSPLIGDTISS